MSGAWSLNEETMEFELQEPYVSKLAEGKRVATAAWTRAMMEWLADETAYESETLVTEFVRRANEQDMHPMEIVDSFIIETLEGNL